MAKLIYIINTSLDLYVEDATGTFDWINPDQAHAAITELLQSIGTCLYGRRLYQTMTYWDGPVEGYLSEYRDFARAWQKTQKIVFSRTLTAATTRHTRIEREFDLEAVRTLKRESAHDIAIGGAELAGLALEADLVDECHLFVNPVIVGGGKPAFRAALRRNLELLGTRRFSSGVIHLHYRVIDDHARLLGEALADAVVVRSKEHFDQSRDLLAETLTPSSGTDTDVANRIAGELVCLSAFIATYAVEVELADDPQYKAKVLREFHTSYLRLCEDDLDRPAVKDRLARYGTALTRRRAHERVDDVLAEAFADVCERTEYDFCSVASDIVAQELIVMRGVLLRT